MDERRLDELIVESQDLQSDARRTATAAIPDLRDLAADRRGQEIDLDAIARLNADRRRFLKTSGLGLGGLAARGVAGGGILSLLGAVVARPVAADTEMDIDILQTAASLELLAVATYEAALGLPFIKDGNPVIVKFAQTTQMQHAEHGMAFNAQAKALGGKEQSNPNPKFLKVVEDAKPTLKAPLDVAKLAATLEEVATDTYLVNLTNLQDQKAQEVMSQVMGVEAQHLATLRAVVALLEADAADLIALPPDLAKLPAAAGSVAFEGAFEEAPAELVAEPSSGAVK